MKQVAGKLRLDLAQFRELAAFAQFSSDLDASTKDQIERGKRITEILKQVAYNPLPLAQQIVILWAVTQGYLDSVPVEKIKDYEMGLIRNMILNYKELLSEVAEKKQLDEEITQKLEKIVVEESRSYSSESENG